MANENETPVVETTTPTVETNAPASPFKTFATEAEYKSSLDRDIQKAVKANEANATKKAEEAARLAQMTAEQKMSAQLDDINAQLKAVKLGKSELAAKETLNKMGLSSEDYVDFLSYIVTTDEEETKGKATSIGAKLLETAKSLAQKQIQETMRAVSVPAGAVGQEAETDDTKYAQLLARVKTDPKNSKLIDEAFYFHEAMLTKGK